MKKFAFGLIGILFLLSLAGPARAYFQKGLIFEQSSRLPSSHASTIVQLLNGDMLCAWYSGTAEGNKDVAIWASWFKQKTGKWTAPYVLADTRTSPTATPFFLERPTEKSFYFL